MTAEIARVMALVALNPGGRSVAREALEIARRHDARLALAHLVDWEAGIDDFSPLSPSEIEHRLKPVIQRKLERMASDIGAHDAALLIGWRAPGHGLSQLLPGWQPDLVVVSRHLGVVTDGRIAVEGWSCPALEIAPSTVRAWREAVGRAAGSLLPSRPLQKSS